MDSRIEKRIDILIFDFVESIENNENHDNSNMAMTRMSIMITMTVMIMTILAMMMMKMIAMMLMMTMMTVMTMMTMTMMMMIMTRSERCSLHAVALLDPIWIDKWHQLFPAHWKVGPAPVFWASRPLEPAEWLALLILKAGDVESNPGPQNRKLPPSA